MKKYDLVKRTAEIKYKDRKEIEEGCTAFDDSPEYIKTFDTLEEAKKELAKRKTDVSKFSYHGMTFYKVEEYVIEENEFEKIEANKIENVIEEYENENNIVVDKICIIKKSQNNYKLESLKNSCVLTYIATRCEWGIKGALQYYEGRKLTQTDIKYLENQEFKLSGKQYKCIGNTLYINVSVY